MAYKGVDLGGFEQMRLRRRWYLVDSYGLAEKKASKYRPTETERGVGLMTKIWCLDVTFSLYSSDI